MSRSNCAKCERGGTGPHPADCSPETRFWRKIKRVGGCWEWQGAQHPAGYGQFRIGNGTKQGRLVYAHRFAYEGSFGAVPDGYEVMHLCDNPRCCRPAHLIVGTHRQNMEDMDRKGRRRWGARKCAEACVHGHPFTDENTYISKMGYRGCRACHRIRENARRKRAA